MWRILVEAVPLTEENLPGYAVGMFGYLIAHSEALRMSWPSGPMTGHGLASMTRMSHSPWSRDPVTSSEVKNSSSGIGACVAVVCRSEG